MARPKKFDKLLVVNVGSPLEEKLRTLASDFDLPLAEITRRSIQIGSEYLSHATFPGCSLSARTVKKAKKL